METPVELGPADEAGPRPLLLVGGHLALDFANTVDDPRGPWQWDHLADYPALLAWSERSGAVPAGDVAALGHAAGQHPQRAAAVVQQAAALRSALNETFGAVVDGRALDTGWARLRPFLVAAIEHMTVEAGRPHPRPHWAFTELESPLWPVAEAGYRLLTDPELARLKRCAGCPWLFLDHSKNHSRRWCSMAICGTSEKIRRYVSKRASRRA
jgi:predicted RNA-binding Zn ribbon-like protein